MGRFDNWEPAQESKELGDPVDLRGAALGPKGYKVNPIKTSRKRKIEEPQDDVMEEQQQQQPEAMDADGGAGAAAAPGAKRQRVEGEPYRTVRRAAWAGTCMPAQHPRLSPSALSCAAVGAAAQQAAAR
jgi:hypothetical protein